MVNPKVKHYFGKKVPTSTSSEDKEKAAHDKQLIENMKKSIAGKLKDPAMAKKAAQILSQMLGDQEQEKSAKS
jgi:hypothetical protein